MYHLISERTRIIAGKHVSDAKGLVLNQNVWST